MILNGVNPTPTVQPQVTQQVNTNQMYYNNLLANLPMLPNNIQNNIRNNRKLT